MQGGGGGWVGGWGWEGGVRGLDISCMGNNFFHKLYTFVFYYHQGKISKNEEKNDSYEHKSSLWKNKYTILSRK